MRKLTHDEINELASKPNVRRIAVENFLMTVTNNSQKQYALANLSLDANLYKWNRETINAIRKGIDLAFKE